jgi:hypothetical protein
MRTVRDSFAPETLPGESSPDPRRARARPAAELHDAVELDPGSGGLGGDGPFLHDLADGVLPDTANARRSGSARRFVPDLERTPRVDHLLKQAVVGQSAVVDVEPPLLLCAS